MTARNAPSPEVEPRPDSFGDLEGPICDATNIAGIFCDMVEVLFTQEPPVRHGEYHMYCDERDRAKLSYAAHEVSEQLLALKSRFYGIYEAELGTKKGGAA